MGGKIKIFRDGLMDHRFTLGKVVGEGGFKGTLQGVSSLDSVFTKQSLDIN